MTTIETPHLDPVRDEAAMRLSSRTTGRHPAAKPDKPADKPKLTRKGPQHNDTVLALIDLMGKGRTVLADHGDLLMQRTVDWHRTPRIPRPSLEDDVDPETVSTLEAEERIGDALASRYRSEVEALTRRIRSDIARFIQVDAIVNRAQPRALAGKDLLATQVAGAGFCVSCWRYEQTIKDREKDKRTDTFYDKEACRRCTAFKAEHGVYPPVQLLEHWHARGKNWTTALVQQALEAAGHTPRKEG